MPHYLHMLTLAPCSNLIVPPHILHLNMDMIIYAPFIVFSKNSKAVFASPPNGSN